jgi:hypothetical protein
LSEHSRIWITKFRTSNLHLPIETGRWYNIPREERICHLCKETIGDEYNFLLVCKNENIITLRNKYLSKNEIIIELTLIMPNLKVFLLFAMQNFLSDYQFLLEKLLPYSDYM